MKGVTRWLCGSLAATGLLVALTAAREPQQTSSFLVQHDWVGKGQWIRGDTHVHTRFSDGGYSPADVATQAVKHGCEVIGFPDHAARRLKGASPEYMAAIQAVRKAQPALAVIAGLEWNVPPFGGDEHATLLVPEGPREDSILAEFKRRFDDSDVVDSPKPDVQAALTWLAQTTAASSVKPVVIYNHPSRKDASSCRTSMTSCPGARSTTLLSALKAVWATREACHWVRTIRRFRWSIAGTRLPLEPVMRGTHCFNAMWTYTGRWRRPTSTLRIRAI